MLDEIDFDSDFKTIGIIGTGLMGGSFGKAIKMRHKDVTVIGFDLNTEELNKALLSGCIDVNAKDLSELAKRSDLIVLATPMRTYENILRNIPADTWKTTWLTDLGSVKGHPYRIVKKLLPENTPYVGGHPMAGSEKCGCLNGSENLFNNAAFYLTSDNMEWIRPVKRLMESLGAVAKVIDVNDHDRIVSVSSHVPHVTASMLVSILHDDISIHETGGGYQDTTRIAGSDPVMWTDILLTNKDELLRSLDQLHSELHKVIAMIDREDEKAIFAFLERTRQKRLGEGGQENGNHNRREAI